jgi:hypothetical protein
MSPRRALRLRPATLGRRSETTAPSQRPIHPGLASLVGYMPSSMRPSSRLAIRAPRALRDGASTGVEAAALAILLLEDVDIGSREAAFPDQEGSRRETGDAASDHIRLCHSSCVSFGRDDRRLDRRHVRGIEDEPTELGHCRSARSGRPVQPGSIRTSRAGSWGNARGSGRGVGAAEKAKSQAPCWAEVERKSPRAELASRAGAARPFIGSSSWPAR